MDAIRYPDAELASIAAKAVGAPVFNRLGAVCVDALLWDTDDMKGRVGVIESTWVDGRHVMANIRFDDGTEQVARII